MMPRPAVPALYPLTLPETWQPLPPAADDAAELFARAARAYHEGRFVDAGEHFLTAARLLLDTSDPDLPDLSGARTVCYVDAVLAALAAGRTTWIDEVLRWVADHDPTCSAAVMELVDRLRLP